MWKVSLILWVVFSICSNILYGQYVVVQKALQDPAWILPDQYRNLDLTMITSSTLSFDPANPYTYLIQIKGDEQDMHQVLVQTDFKGRLLYAGMTSKIWALFHLPEKPMNGFKICMGSIDNVFVIKEPIQILIDCIVERLKYCSY
jgi:hypothetical protein